MAMWKRWKAEFLANVHGSIHFVCGIRATLALNIVFVDHCFVEGG